MNISTLAQENKYKQFLSSLYAREVGTGARFSMNTSLKPVILTDEESTGFEDRYALIEQFWKISECLFEASFTDPSLRYIRDLILNEVNAQFAIRYHKELFANETHPPLFFRTDECIPGKIAEIQSPGSGWGILNSLQESLSQLQRNGELKVRSFNRRPVGEQFAQNVLRITKGDPRIFHAIDESSNMVDTNYFISSTRKYGLRYLGRDSDITLKNVNFVRTHSFMEEVSGSCFFEFLNRYLKGELWFDTFPNILFFQKIALIFPFWEKTKHLYPDEIRSIFPYTALVTDTVTLESGEELTVEKFSRLPPHERYYYLKYGGADGTINWGSKAVYHLGKNSGVQCKALLGQAAKDSQKKRYWILQKAYNKKVNVTFVNGGEIAEKNTYGKWSGFYGPDGFMGGFIMNRDCHKVHGQEDTVCRILL